MVSEIDRLGVTQGRIFSDGHLGGGICRVCVGGRSEIEVSEIRIVVAATGRALES